jgi:hypothetical protein
MSAAVEFVHRLRYTPMRDVLRGRLTGCLDVKRQIAAADIPAPAKQLIARVVRRARLRPWEKLEVADDLLAHFAEGLLAGETIDELLARFGNEGTAAKLIGRAKRRARPIGSQIATAARYGLIALALSYAVIAAVFFAGRPAPMVVSVAPQAPPDQEAMPLYLQAARHIGGPGRYTSGADIPTSFTLGISKPAEFEPYVAKFADEIELVRRAAAKPLLGTPPADRDVPTMLRCLAWPLGFDGAVAASRGDRERLMRDLRATIEMAPHARQTGRGIEGELLAATLLDQTAVVLRRVLEDYPGVPSDEDLQALAHALAGPKTPADVLTYAAARRAFHGAVARAYTDDGRGDGRITPAGLENLVNSSSLSREALRSKGLAPAAMLVVASRREVTRQFDEALDQIVANLRRPRRQVDWTPLRLHLAELRKPNPRYPLVAESIPPAPDLLHDVLETYLERRDAVLIGIALELFRRRHEHYPTSLSELSPAFLPTIPVDRVSGEPLKYRLIDGKPIVYSMSFDRDDDGGYDDPMWGSSWDSSPADEDEVLFGIAPTTRPTTLNPR